MRTCAAACVESSCARSAARQRQPGVRWLVSARQPAAATGHCPDAGAYRCESRRPGLRSRAGRRSESGVRISCRAGSIGTVRSDAALFTRGIRISRTAKSRWERSSFESSSGLRSISRRRLASLSTCRTPARILLMESFDSARPRRRCVRPVRGSAGTRAAAFSSGRPARARRRQRHNAALRASASSPRRDDLTGLGAVTTVRRRVRGWRRDRRTSRTASPSVGGSHLNSAVRRGHVVSSLGGRSVACGFEPVRRVRGCSRRVADERHNGQST